MKKKCTAASNGPLNKFKRWCCGFRTAKATGLLSWQKLHELFEKWHTNYCVFHGLSRLWHRHSLLLLDTQERFFVAKLFPNRQGNLMWPVQIFVGWTKRPSRLIILLTWTSIGLGGWGGTFIACSSNPVLSPLSRTKNRCVCRGLVRRLNPWRLLQLGCKGWFFVIFTHSYAYIYCVDGITFAFPGRLSIYP